MTETLSALLPASDREFIETKLPTITGWLGQDAAYFIAYMMNFQAEKGLKGPSVEFGVYHGKLLCLLLNQSLKHGDLVIGYDIFEQSHYDTPKNHAIELFGSSDKMLLGQRSSTDLTAKEIIGVGGRKPRVVSVDGDHTAKGALHDFWLAQNLVDPRGIVIADDVYNTYAIGVSEAFFRYQLSWRSKLVPFAQINNKTMLCAKDQYQSYFDMSLKFVDDCPDLAVSERFIENRSKGESWVIQELLDRKVVLLN